MIKTQARQLWPVATIVGYFGIVVLFCNPLYNTPMYDDWAYSGNVKRLLDTGELRLVWTQVSFVAQLFSAALFCLPFGFSFSTLHAYSLLLGVAGIIAFYGLARHYDYSRTISLLLGLALASTPFYLHFCFTFMTDIPSAATNIIAIWAFAAAERRHQRGEKSRVLYGMSVFFFVFSAMVRDFAILMIPPMLAAWYVNGRSRGPHRLMIWVIPFSILCHVASGIFVDAPFRTMKLISHLFAPDPIMNAYVVLAWIGLCLSPILIALTPDLFTRYIGRKRSKQILFLAVLAVSIGMAGTMYLYSTRNPHLMRDALMPYGPGFISAYGPYNQRPLPGMRSLFIGFEFRIVLTVIAAYGTAVIGFVLVQCLALAIESGRTNTRLRNLTGYLTGLAVIAAVFSAILEVKDGALSVVPHLDAIVELGLFGAAVLGCIFLLMSRGRHKAIDHAISPIRFPELAAGGFFLVVGAWVCYVLNGKYFIRYSLAMVPGVCVLLFSVFRNLRLIKPILIIGVVVLTVCSIVITRDQISFNEARWAAGRWLLSRGVNADEIVGGFEFDCWHLEFRGKRPSKDHVMIGDVWIIPRFILTLDNFDLFRPRGFKGLPDSRRYLGHTYYQFIPPDGARFPYTSFMNGGYREVQIWRSPDFVSPIRRKAR